LDRRVTSLSIFRKCFMVNKLIEGNFKMSL
jgi:hypothetical protein